MRFALLALALCSAAAQDVGLGVRQAGAKRFEVPYTLAIETPYVPWARPLAGGPISLLAVPTVGEGRTLIELAQRLSLDLTTVSIDPDWDVNKWTMAFGADYGARAEKGDLKLVYSYLERELTSAKKFDAILLPLHHGWQALTPASRDALARRVRDGCGLVLVRPFASELSPITPQDLKPEDGELMESVEPGPVESSPWRRTGDHFITRAIPIESFPPVKNFLYRAEPNATVLARSATGHPILAVRQFGKGRVVAFAYRNAGLSWLVPMSDRGRFPGVYWEYFYSLLCRSLIWAAAREPRSPADFSSTWRLRTEQGQIQRAGRGRPPKFTALAPGRYFLERQAAADWDISTLDVPQPDRIEDLAATPAVISEGAAVDVTWRGTRPATIELIDGFGRVVARAAGNGAARLTPGRPLTHSGFLRATCGTAVEQLLVRYAAPSREWDDYEVMLPWFGPHGYQPWIPALDEQFRKIGITTLADPDRNFKLMVSAHLPGFGIYWYRRDAYLARKKAYAETGDKKYLVREVNLESPAFEAGMRAQLEKSLRPVAPLKPMASYLADESSLTFYGDAYDVDWAPESLAGFRRWLRGQYASLDELNASWGTSFGDWESTLPMTTAEAQRHGNFAPWADHRAYMERQFVEAFGKARDLVREIDPGARASISGTQSPNAHNGCNWYEIDQRIDYLQPYSGGNQDPMHHLFRPDLTITGFTGYGLVGPEAQYQQWQRLFYGHRGASIFWHYTLLNPDLTLSEQGQALAEAFGRIQGGIGRVFLNSKVHEDGVAIHFSMASLRGAWITDGKIPAGLGSANETSKSFAELMKRRDGWVKRLERDGVQFRFLATPQIESGALDAYRVLILPYSIAISEREARQIERFIARGGLVYGDEQTGRMDERCHWRKQPPFQVVATGPRDIGVRRNFDGEALVTVRDFGAARLTGVLPRKAARIPAPASRGPVYDLLRGGLAQPSVEASLERPALFLERPTRIARLTLDRSLELRLLDDAGTPVDLSVIHLDVFDPAGNLVRYYSGNLTLRDGRARFQIPFALSDHPGPWRVRARDIVSNLTAEVSLPR